MAARSFERCCTHALRYKTLQLRLNCMVFGGNDIPAWLRFPCSSRDLLAKQIGNRCRLSRPNESLLVFREIASKRRNPVSLQPHAPIANSDVGKISVGENWSCRLCGVAASAGASAARETRTATRGPVTAPVITDPP